MPAAGLRIPTPFRNYRYDITWNKTRKNIVIKKQFHVTGLLPPLMVGMSVRVTRLEKKK